MKTFLIIILMISLWLISGFIAFYLSSKHIFKFTESTPMREVKDHFILCIMLGLLALFIAVFNTIAEILKNPIENFLIKFISRINNKR